MNTDMEVLVVDDLTHMRRLVKTMLKNLGFRSIHEAGDGKEALEVLGTKDIGLIVSDWNMPNMTGIEFLRQIRSMEKYRDTPFLMVTAEATKENIVEAIGAGVSNYVVKPVQADIFESKLGLILKKK